MLSWVAAVSTHDLISSIGVFVSTPRCQRTYSFFERVGSCGTRAVEIFHEGIWHTIARGLKTLQSKGYATRVLGAVRTFNRKCVLEAEMVEKFLPALFQFVDQVGVIKDCHARMGNSMARKFISALGQRVQLFPGNAASLICGGFMRGHRFKRSLTHLRVRIVDNPVCFGKVLSLVVCFAGPCMEINGP